MVPRVGGDLDFDMAGTGQVAFDVDGVVAEGSHRLATGRGHGVVDLVRVLDDPHSLSAASGRGLEQGRVADLGHRLAQALWRLVLGLDPRHDRHPDRCRKSPNINLRPGARDDRG